MRIGDYIAFRELIHAGGPGSGCHGDNCGRPSNPHEARVESFRRARDQQVPGSTLHTYFDKAIKDEQQLADKFDKKIITKPTQMVKQPLLEEGVTKNVAGVSVSGKVAETIKVAGVLSSLSSQMLMDSLLRRVIVYKSTPENKTLMVGDVVGHMVSDTMRLYPGFTKETVGHEFGHSLEFKYLDRYAQHLVKTGKAARPGYGTASSALKESFANSFASYIALRGTKDSKDSFWTGIYGK